MSIKQRVGCGRYICKQGLSLSSLGTGMMMMMTMVMIWGTMQECQQKKRQVFILGLNFLVLFMLLWTKIFVTKM